MKKFYIPVLALLIVFSGFGCSKKSGTAQSDTLGTVPGTPTTCLQPPTISPGPPPAAGSILITATSQPADQITVNAVFSGSSTNQTVTVTSNPAGTQLASLSNTPGGSSSATLPGPGVGVTYTITAQVNGIAYMGVTNVPNNPCEPTIASTYTDASGNTAVVNVSDVTPR